MLQDPLIRTPIAISLGAIAGALSRYYLTLWCAKVLGNGFPYGTFFINVSGCLAMGFLTTLFLERIPTVSPEVRLMVTTGFLGAYTTFSTYGLDAVTLWRERTSTLALFYWVGSAVLGIGAVLLGASLARLGK
ncbi:fluoride efflux transporter CrcB [Oscillatoria sp. FACHB-1407]|uniref:fluoride efflux transporter CrcB n=1 Tax=Oscillatoria sp. FACHB-1407 TaxID=2692847 RepID=UPI00168259F0|nr:fluoride efflux transporter CrcB [Oscillatoria sp. FACHB-1407]MBD2459440.1 fluoride efflux transporter CrcB [Oscillatoria sp. FACHB-1407]